MLGYVRRIYLSHSMQSLQSLSFFFALWPGLFCNQKEAGEGEKQWCGVLCSRSLWFLPPLICLRAVTYDISILWSPPPLDTYLVVEFCFSQLTHMWCVVIIAFNLYVVLWDQDPLDSWMWCNQQDLGFNTTSTTYHHRPLLDRSTSSSCIILNGRGRAVLPP